MSLGDTFWHLMKKKYISLKNNLFFFKSQEIILQKYKIVPCLISSMLYNDEKLTASFPPYVLQ